ncbi:hypothetical protein B0H12DRAFT_1102313 [Mycena haematopus]|nr:hypothetical protein B0H12DRAFT_1102313 [Mycena haematopus]
MDQLYPCCFCIDVARQSDNRADFVPSPAFITRSHQSQVHCPASVVVHLDDCVPYSSASRVKPNVTAHPRILAPVFFFWPSTSTSTLAFVSLRKPRPNRAFLSAFVSVCICLIEPACSLPARFCPAPIAAAVRTQCLDYGNWPLSTSSSIHARRADILCSLLRPVSRGL